MNFSLFARGMHVISCLPTSFKFPSFKGGPVESAHPDFFCKMLISPRSSYLRERRRGDGNICTVTLEQTGKWFSRQYFADKQAGSSSWPQFSISTTATSKAANISGHEWNGKELTCRFHRIQSNEERTPSSISLFSFESFCCAGFPP